MYKKYRSTLLTCTTKTIFEVPLKFYLNLLSANSLFCQLYLFGFYGIGELEIIDLHVINIHFDVLRNSVPICYFLKWWLKQFMNVGFTVKFRVLLSLDLDSKEIITVAINLLDKYPQILEYMASLL